MKSFVTLIAGLLMAVTVSAQEIAPDILVKNVTNEVLDIVRKDKDIQGGNTRKAVELIEVKVLPYFNFVRMTQSTLGKSWRDATPAQQKALTEEFRTLLVRTYSAALTGYKNQTIEFKPFSMNAGDTEVRVRSEIKQSSGQPIPLDYFLEKGGPDWKVVDIKVYGVSLTANYLDTFKTTVRNDGIDGLIAVLQKKNKSGEAAAVKK
jgi:phospholipid transport system substrate-binding protein